jgi:hypothetical protein
VLLPLVLTKVFALARQSCFSFENEMVWTTFYIRKTIKI